MKKFNIIKFILSVGLFLLIGSFLIANAQQASNANPTTNEVNLSSFQTKASELSAIEKSFPPSSLRQVGYDFFQNFQTQGFGKYEGSYKLNIGEKINVYFWGDSVDMLSLTGSSLISPLTNTQVDTKGNIFVPGIGVVKADGCSINDVEKSIQSLASQKFTNAKVRITVADSTEFAVFVYGYVNKPGKIAIGNNSSIIEALAAAGGVNKNGSLRNITYSSANKSQKVDLYDVIFNGKDNNIRLKPNDTIFVNNIGDVVAINNGVKIPGIYELSSNETVSALISFAGGILPSTNNDKINIKSYDKIKGERVSKDIQNISFNKTKLANGDIVEFSSLFGKAENFVTLEGNVKHPAIFQYKNNMKLSDILPDSSELQDESLVYQAVIKRVSNKDKQIKTISVSLEDFFNGCNDPVLFPKDIVTVYKSTNADFIEVFGCIDNPKNIPYQEKLTLNNILAGVNFVASADTSNIENINNTETKPTEAGVLNINRTTPETDEKTIISVTTSKNKVLIPASNIAVEITNLDSGNTVLYYLYDIMVKNDATKAIAINKNDKVLFRTLRDDEILKTVKISGYVKNPGVYTFIEGKKLTEMLQEAGGLKDDANLKGIVLKRESLAIKQKEISIKKDKKDIDLIKGQMAKDTDMSSNDAQSQKLLIDQIRADVNVAFDGRIILNIKENDTKKISKSENIEIQDGDEIYIPKLANYVAVMGEVYNESAFVYQPHKNASYYISLVGGYTPNASKFKIYKIASNGKAYRMKHISCAKIEPGDTIVVPRKLKGNEWIEPASKAMQAIAGMFTALFVVTKL
jgi:protein involved in polysaccharide export with SLBB domain